MNFLANVRSALNFHKAGTNHPDGDYFVDKHGGVQEQTRAQPRSANKNHKERYLVVQVATRNELGAQRIQVKSDKNIPPKGEEVQGRISKGPLPRPGQKVQVDATAALDLCQIILDMPHAFPLQTQIDLDHLDSYAFEDLVDICEKHPTAYERLRSGTWNAMWEQKRIQYGAPGCSGRLSEAEWALFLLGSTCQECGDTDGRLDIDFFLLKRFCSVCRVDGVISYIDACAQDLCLVEALNYINFTPCPAERTPRTKARWFAKADVARLSNEWKDLQENLVRGLPGSTETFNNFKEVCLSNVTFVQENAPLWRDWYLIDREKKFGRNSGEMILRQQLAELVRPRFYAASRFDRRDINRTIGEESKDLRTALPFRCDFERLVTNERRMENLYSRLAGSIEATRSIRVELIVLERLSLVVKMWEVWVASLGLPIVDTWSLPGRLELSRVPIVASLLASDAFPTLEDYRRAECEFRRIAEGFVLTTKEVLGRSVPNPPEGISRADVLELATSVFTPHFATFQAKNHPIIVGLKAHAGWRHTPHRASVECDFDPWLSRISRGLGELCALPDTSTAEDMDREDQRFTCAVCYDAAVARLGEAAIHDLVKTVEAEVFTWRLALSHAYAEHQHDRHSLRFRLLTAHETRTFDALTEVQTAEKNQRSGIGQDPEATRVWLCNHCPEGPSKGSPTTLNNIIKHVRKEHVNGRRVNSNDYFIHEGLRLQYERLRKNIHFPVALLDN